MDGGGIRQPDTAIASHEAGDEKGVFGASRRPVQTDLSARDAALPHPDQHGFGLVEIDVENVARVPGVPTATVPRRDGAKPAAGHEKGYPLGPAGATSLAAVKNNDTRTYGADRDI